MRTIPLFLLVFTISLNTFSAFAEEATPDHTQMSGMSGMSGMSKPDENKIYSGSGLIKAWNSDTVDIAHGPIDALSWPAMTMTFDIKNYQGKTFSPGQQVDFTFRQSGSGFSLVSVTAK